MVPYPAWLNAGDNSWQMTAATLVGLMSIPALAVLYGGLVQRKWAMNTVMMVFSTFCLVLITWVLWAFKMGFGHPWISTYVGIPGTVLGHNALQGQADVPLLDGLMPKFRFPQASLVYFQFVFAAITPILFIGSVIGRISFKVWLIFVPLWITFAYAVNGSCSGVAATGRRARSTSVVVTSSTSLRARRGSWPPPSSGRGWRVTENARYRTT